MVWDCVVEEFFGVEPVWGVFRGVELCLRRVSWCRNGCEECFVVWWASGLFCGVKLVSRGVFCGVELVIVREFCGVNLVVFGVELSVGVSTIK